MVTRPLSWPETAAVLYLVAPLFIFLASFVRPEIGVAACALIAFLIYELVRGTSWHEPSALRWDHLYFLGLAAFWVWLSGGFGPFAPIQNGDWAKHNLIISFLAEHSWPPTADIPQLGNLTLRYYIGWHLVPSLILKLTSISSPALAAAMWSILGVFLFFSLLPRLLQNRAALIAAPLVFILFGGADFLGTQITHHSMGPPHHLEWWAGWAQYSSNTTALFWSPQQAIPAWVAVALLMRCRELKELIPYCALVVSAALLWSPFAAIGLIPFLLALLVRNREIALGWRPILCAFILALPVALYLSAGTGSIPHGYIGAAPCRYGPCFSWPSYFLLLAIEVCAPLTILFVRRQPEQGFLVAAAAALLVLPLYKMGTFNDFVMRASLPSLAVVAILCGKVIADSKPYRLAVLAVLLVAFPAVFGELSRGFISTSRPPVMDLNTAGKWWIEQTFTSQPIWLLR